MRYGIRSVSMDDIARELGISKKTLYQQVDNKSALLRDIFVCRTQEDLTAITAMRTEASNAIDEMVGVVRFMIERLRLISPNLRFDLEKYYADIHNELDELHETFFEVFIRENLSRGISEGIYRPRIQVEIVAKLFVVMANRMGRNEVFDVHKYTLDQLVEQLFIYHLHGVISERGVAVMREYLGQEEEEHI